MMAEAVAIKPRTRRAHAESIGMDELALKVGMVMGEMAGMKTQMAQGDQQRDRMEDKLDRMPDAFRDALAPLADQVARGFKAHSARLDAHEASIAELKKDDAEQKAGAAMVDKWKTKAVAGLVAAATVAGGAAGIWATMFHK